ncbi:MAG: hypothetical protein HY245_11780 [Rhizobiales bacterium]|nr:hypothetical protein [Hyphomicrobiales bacterium]
MAEWSSKTVEDRLTEAADVMKRLPPVKVQGYFNTRPAVLRDFSDRVGQEPTRMRRPPPSPDAITRAEATLLWLRWLELEDARLVWLRAGRARWREICQRFCISRATANRRYDYALTVIVWRLERRPLQPTWSRRFLLQRARVIREAL